MDKWFKDILPDKDPYHNRGRDQMRKKGGPEFECLLENVHRCEVVIPAFVLPPIFTPYCFGSCRVPQHFGGVPKELGLFGKENYLAFDW
jgi:hypothetical protein